jgi:uncharacterized protein (DUF736 family)
MSVIGAFTAAKDGGWTGVIRTLTIAAKIRLIPNVSRCVGQRANWGGLGGAVNGGRS